MKIVSNWWQVIRFGWQFRLNILAAVFGALEFALPYIREIYYVPDRLFLIGSIVTVIISNIARLVAQNKVSRNGES